MKLSVVILNYNVRYFLEQCVLSVQNAIQNIDAEIIVVDNNSSDDSCMMMKTHFPKIRFIENKENSGFPKGNNLGVAMAQGEYLCILNPDTVVAEDTFTKILAFAENQSDLGIVGCKLIDGTGNFLPESKRGIPTPFVAFTKIFSLYQLFPNFRPFGKYYAAHLSENQTGKVDILVGAFMLLKRDLYLQVGGFDENCFMYSDDIDLSYTILKTGKSNYYFHETTVIHYKGESTVRDKKYRKRFQEAMDFFYKKHFSGNGFRPFLFSVFMKMGAFFFVFLKKQQAVTAKAIVDRYCLLSENEKLRTKIENTIEKKGCRIDSATENALNLLSDSDSANTEIIFDNNYWSFKAIIESMEKLKDNHFTFKILPKNANFIIGSNNSNDRGEIIQLNN